MPFAIPSKPRPLNGLSGRTVAAIWCSVSLATVLLYATAPEPVLGQSLQAPSHESKRIELVRVFECAAAAGMPCAASLENQANSWLQKAQPGVRIVARQLVAADQRVTLALFYEVPDWRASGKIPAEAPPR